MTNHRISVPVACEVIVTVDAEDWDDAWEKTADVNLSAVLGVNIPKETVNGASMQFVMGSDPDWDSASEVSSDA